MRFETLLVRRFVMFQHCLGSPLESASSILLLTKGYNNVIYKENCIPASRAWFQFAILKFRVAGRYVGYAAWLALCIKSRVT